MKYPKWKHLVSEKPTKQELDWACQQLYKDDAQYCKIIDIQIDKHNGSLTVESRKITSTNGGILIDYTDEPVNPREIYYSGAGIPRDWDENGKAFYLLDIDNNYPTKWIQVKAEEIIRNCIKQYMSKGKLLRTGKLLKYCEVSKPVRKSGFTFADIW